jgi:diguanylate cyclase (GGDEF)-like protein
MDIDEFKAINDGDSHSAGDQVLARAARALQAAFDDAALIGRMEGDEFVVLTSASSSDPEHGTSTLSERLEAVRGALRPVTVSVGGTHLLADNTLHSALHRADEALMQAKRDGRDRLIMADDSSPRSGPRELDRSSR